jgi:hypothetical protein
VAPAIESAAHPPDDGRAASRSIDSVRSARWVRNRCASPAVFHLGALARLAQLPTELKTDTRQDIVTLPSARSVRNRCAMGKFGRVCNAAGKPIG